MGRKTIRCSHSKKVCPDDFLTSTAPWKSGIQAQDSPMTFASRFSEDRLEDARKGVKNAVAILLSVKTTIGNIGLTLGKRFDLHAGRRNLIYASDSSDSSDAANGDSAVHLTAQRKMTTLIHKSKHQSVKDLGDTLHQVFNAGSDLVASVSSAGDAKTAAESPPATESPPAKDNQPGSVATLKDLPLLNEIEKLRELSVVQEFEKLKDLSVVQEIEKLRPAVERWRDTIPSVSTITKFVDNMPPMSMPLPAWWKASQLFPDKQRLSSVQEFFRYTELEGRKLFEELDSDGDGQVKLEDLEGAMRRRRLPVKYAREFLRRTRRHWLANSFGWDEFRVLMEQKEAGMLRAFTSLSVNSSGTLQKSQVLASLKRAGLPATEDNARAMMSYLDADLDRGQIAYGQFRNFMLLLPPERLERDPSMVWFEAATVVPMSPPMSAPAGSVIKSALAGGLASGLSTCVMHPLDTLKTRVQASSVTFSEVLASVPKGGVVPLYRGSIPAIVGQFASHGLRTGVFEASKMLLQRAAPDMSDLQIQPIASLCSTVLGTGLRIPCEVLKQRLQAGLYPNVLAAIHGTLVNEGAAGFFCGTTATLCREVPFYVAGMLIYQEAKKAAKQVVKRELAPWETLVLGGVSGGLAAVSTTPFDVIKTRMMISAPGGATGLIGTGMAIVAGEGVLALYKGAVPRFFWIAPLGAMNFAGYELAKQAIDKQSSS